ncbi:MAG: Ig-like domain-containing protein, partial [Planctomycetota bacterium]
INPGSSPGSFTPIKDGDKIIGFEYTPDLGAASFDPTTGETTDYAKITYTVTDGFNTSKEGDDGVVDVDLFNLIPVGEGAVILESKNVSPIEVTEANPSYTFVIGTDGDDDEIWIVDGSINPGSSPGSFTPIKDGDKIIGFEYTPDLGAASFSQIVGDQGETADYAQFTYQVTDGFNTSKEGDDGIVDVDLFNKLPVARPDTYLMGQDDVSLVVPVEDGVIIDAVTGRDFDPDGDPLAAFLDNGGTTTQGGSISLNKDGSFTYLPPADFSGQDSFTYFVNDGFNDSRPVDVLITVPIPGVPPAPLPRFEYPEIGGCPALTNWLANELGVGAEQIQVYMANVMAWSKSIQPCNMCARLRDAATTLTDPGGVHLSALAQVVNEFVTPAVPPTDEQMALIASAVAEGVDDPLAPQYAFADRWLDALAAYVGILSTELGLSEEEALALVEKYLEPVNESGNEALVLYVQAQLAAYTGM